MSGLRRWADAALALSRRQGTRDVGWSLAGTGVQTALGIVTTILVARALGPSGFGVLSVVLALVFVVSGLADVGFTGSVIRLGSPEVMQGRDVRHLHTTFLVLRVCAASLLAVAVAVAGRWLFPSLRLPGQYAWLGGIAGAAGVAMAVGVHYGTVLQVARSQRTLSLLRSTASALRLLAYGILAWGPGLTLPRALAVALVAIPVEAALGIWAAHRTIRLWPLVLRPPPREWLTFSAWAAVPAMVGPLIGQTDTLLLAGMATAADTGIWSAAARVAGMATLVSGALFAVAFPYATGALEHGQLQRYWRLARVAWGAIAAACLLGIPLAPWMVGLLYGRAFGDAVPVLQLLLAANALATGVLLLVPVAYRLGRERLVAVVALAEVTVNLGGDVLLFPRFGAVGCAFATLVMYAIALALILPSGSARALSAVVPEAGPS